MKRVLLWSSVLGILGVATVAYAVEGTTWGRVKMFVNLSSSQDIAVAAKRGGQPKVDICHWDADEEIYALIRVAAPAEAAHLAHGDEVPGGDVLDGNCEPLPQEPSTGDVMTAELPGGATMDFVWIEPGMFTMGSPDSESGRFSDEGPQHEVTIRRGFWLGRYEITQAQWESVMGTTPWVGQSYVQAHPNHPAVYISWNDMETFVGRLNEAAGETLYRLPTEAEWEYAARAGTTTRWSFGEDESQLRDYAWYAESAWNAGLQYAQPVGTKRPNPWGLYDMHGNVWEWVQDWYDSSYYGSSPSVDPPGPTTGSGRVFRGSAFSNSARRVRSASRSRFDPGLRNFVVGVRLLRIR